MRNSLLRFSTSYGLGSGFLTYHSAGLCGLIILLSLGATAFGIAMGLVAAVISINLAGASIPERVPSLALLLLVAYSGLFNDFRLSALVLAAALVFTPIMAGIGDRGSTSLLHQIAKVLVGWLPAGIIACSLNTLAIRDASSAGLFLILVYSHDLGLELCGQRRLAHKFAPILAVSGALTLLWTSVQISVSPISPQQYWFFACVLSVTILLGRLTTQLFASQNGRQASLLASHVVAAPLWTAAVVALSL